MYDNRRCTDIVPGEGIHLRAAFERAELVRSKGPLLRPPLSKSIRTALLYNTWLGRLLLQLPVTWWLLSWEHKRIAAYASSPKSVSKIRPMIKAYRIRIDDAAREVDEYRTLQDFFTRELKPGARPIAEPDNPAVAVNPADSRSVVFPTLEEARRLWIKGKSFSVPKLLGPSYDPSEWKECAILVSRLSPVDCHRLHAPVTGRVAKVSRQGTRFLASMWVAVHSSMNVMTENERLIMEFDTRDFGPIVMVMIGASDVGSVQPLVKEGAPVRKGDEVGVFAFGSSIVATVFRPGAILFDRDLIQNSARRCETRVSLGTSLGRAAAAAELAPAGGGGGGGEVVVGEGGGGRVAAGAL